jgi:tRNA 2-thiouridine synthesizing protein D
MDKEAIKNYRKTQEDRMKIGIIISTGDPETLWNAFRFANLCLNREDEENEVTIFLNAKAVAYESADSKQFNIKEQAKAFVLAEGKLLACGKCLGFRGLQENEVCHKGGQKDLYEMVVTSDKLICF